MRSPSRRPSSAAAASARTATPRPRASGANQKPTSAAAAGTLDDDVLGRAYAVTAMVARHAIAHENARRAHPADFGYDAVDLAPFPHLAMATEAFARSWSEMVRRGVTSLLCGTA